MRVRTESKRREIVQIATALFVEQGFERTSMSAIAGGVGGSKATLYGYFQSKDELLRAVLADSVTENTERLIQLFPANEDLRQELIRLGVKFLSLSEQMHPLLSGAYQCRLIPPFAGMSYSTMSAPRRRGFNTSPPIVRRENRGIFWPCRRVSLNAARRA